MSEQQTITAKSVYEFLQKSGLMVPLKKKPQSCFDTSSCSSDRSFLSSTQNSSLSSQSFVKPQCSAVKSSYRSTQRPNRHSSTFLNQTKSNDSILNGKFMNPSMTSTNRRPPQRPPNNELLKSSLRKRYPAQLKQLPSTAHSAKKTVTFNEQNVKKLVLPAPKSTDIQDLMEAVVDFEDAKKTKLDAIVTKESSDAVKPAPKSDTFVKIKETTRTTDYLLTPVKTTKTVKSWTPISSIHKSLRQPGLNTSDIDFIEDELMYAVDSNSGESSDKVDDADSTVKIHVSDADDKNEENQLLMQIERNSEQIQMLTNNNLQLLQKLNSIRKKCASKDVIDVDSAKSVESSAPAIPSLKTEISIPSPSSPPTEKKSLDNVEVKSNRDHHLDSDLDSDSDTEFGDRTLKPFNDRLASTTTNNEDSFSNCFSNLQLNDKSLCEYNLMRSKLMPLKSPKLLLKPKSFVSSSANAGDAQSTDSHNEMSFATDAATTATANATTTTLSAISKPTAIRINRSLFNCPSPGEKLSLRVQKQLLKIYSCPSTLNTTSTTVTTTTTTATVTDNPSDKENN